MQKNKGEKLAWIQWLRVFAAAAVVLMHTAGSHWNVIGYTDPRWCTLTWYNALVRWPVPVFMMITGALFLPRRTPMKRMLTVYIPRVLVCWLVWSGVYTFDAWRNGAAVDTLNQIFVSAHYHLWYLPWLAGVYLTIPFLQRIAEDETLEKQLLAVSFVIGIAVPWLANLASLVFPAHGVIIRALENHLNFTFFLDCLFLVLLGHRLSRWEPSEKERRWLYALGLLGVAVTPAATMWASSLAGGQSSVFLDFKGPNNLLAAAAVFVFARYHLNRLPRVVELAARCSFGIYLVHPLILETLERVWGIHALSNEPLFQVPVLAAAVFGISLAVTALLRKVPLIGTYVV